jgi:hypothetical protein
MADNGLVERTAPFDGSYACSPAHQQPGIALGAASGFVVDLWRRELPGFR